MAEFSTDQKREIILAAITAAGPGADDGQVAGQIGRIVGLFEDGSPAMRAFERAEKRAENTVEVTGFRGDILFVDLEETSKRPIVFFRTQISTHAPEGIELVRLGRIDSADKEQVQQLANLALALVGHTVGVTKAIEKGGNGNNRVLRALEDQGVAADLAGLTNQDGAKMIPWETGGKGNFAKIAPKLARLNKYRAAEAAQQPALAGV